MTKNALFLLVAITLIAACSPSIQAVPSLEAATTTSSPVPPTPTQTKTPPTPTLTPTPALAIPVSQLTPVPSSNTRISAENVDELQEIARYYGKINYAVRLTKDEKFLFFLDPEAVTKYNYESMEPLAKIEIASSASDLQISSDGTWILVDNNFLLDWRNESEPKKYILPEVLDFRAHLFALSPDGSMLAAQRYRCPNLCDHELLIVSTEDFSTLHRDTGQTLQNVFAFSPDGNYYAVVDRGTQETPGGGTAPAGAVASVWTTSDFTKVSSIPVRFPFDVSSIAISEDNTLLALSQQEFIDLFEILTGEAKTTIGHLCLSYQRKIMFAPSTIPPKLLENSDCSSMVWSIVDKLPVKLSSSLPSFSNVVFRKNGKYESIPYPQPTSDVPVSEWYQFLFMNNDVLRFQSGHSPVSYSCDLALRDGTYACRSYSTEIVNGEYIGKNEVLATDGKYYAYQEDNNKIDIFSPENKNQVYYSLPFHDYAFDLLALDPIHQVIIFERVLSMRINKIVIQNMQNDRVLAEYEGETFISSLAFSGNKRYAALCRTIGYTSNPNKDRLIILDLAEKELILNETFTCSGAGLTLNHDGSKLAIYHYYLKNPSDSEYSDRLLVFNTEPPYDRKYSDVDAARHAIAFSPDGSLLALACDEIDICFYDAATNNKISQLKAHSQISNIAFSPDGNILAIYSSWGLNSLWAIPPFGNRAHD